MYYIANAATPPPWKRILHSLYYKKLEVSLEKVVNDCGYQKRGIINSVGPSPGLPVIAVRAGCRPTEEWLAYARQQ